MAKVGGNEVPAKRLPVVGGALGLSSSSKVGTSRQASWLYLMLFGVAIALLARRIWLICDQQGLFMWVGFDYGLYWAQAMVLRFGDPAAMYDRVSLEAYHQLLGVYRRDPQMPFTTSYAPYLPLFAWLFTPFTFLPPPLGFLVWTGVNFLAAVHLARRVAGLLPTERRGLAALIVVTAFPIVITLMLGQVTILLACAVAECYLALRAGRDFRAGLWLACTALKPQYGILLGLLLLWKRRWAAVAGAAAGVAGIVIGSLLVAGTPTLLAWVTGLGSMTGFEDSLLFPKGMINWRAFVLNAAPQIPGGPSIVLVVLLDAVTILCTILAWRGPWMPADPRFPAKMLLLLLATLLVSYHNPNHGAAILAVPLAAVLTRYQPNPIIRLTVLWAGLLPTLAMIMPAALGAFSPAERSMVLAIVVCFGALLAQMWLPARPRA